MKCGLKSCKYRSREFGVCGVHKKHAYTSDDPNFLLDMEKLRVILNSLDEEATSLEEKGINLLDIQAAWDFNLVGPRKNPFPPGLDKAGHLIESSLEQIRTMQEKYNSFLVSNATSRLQHSYSKEPCHCSICSLGE